MGNDQVSADLSGALTGFKLREVADHTGVNRGLLYDYFGWRGRQLRRTLKRDG